MLTNCLYEYLLVSANPPTPNPPPTHAIFLRFILTWRPRRDLHSNHCVVLRKWDWSIFWTGYEIKTSPYASNNKVRSGIWSRYSRSKWFKVNLLMTLFRFSLNVHPDSEIDIFCITFNCNFRFLILLGISFISRFILKFFKFCFGVIPVFLNV